jgi:hypothetical protein
MSKPSSAAHTQAPAEAGYQPPTLVVLGSVAQLTLGAAGSFMDQNGNGEKKCKIPHGCNPTP